MTLHVFNDVVNDFESTRTVIIASLKSGPTCKLINRIPSSRLLIFQVYQAQLQECMLNRSARMHVESFGKPRDSTSILKDLPDKLDIKRHSVFSMDWKSSTAALLYSNGTTGFSKL